MTAGPWQILICIIIILVLFGGKKIPELMKGLGKGVKEYKKAKNSIEKEIDSIADISDKEKQSSH